MPNFYSMDPNLAALTAIVIALLLGVLLGVERSLAGKTAGVRTYGLVSMGSCLFILISRFVIPMTPGYQFDPMRIAAAIVMGIGFLCGGVIVFKDSTLIGLTTAAGLWVAAGVGMASGFGLYMLAAMTTVATLAVFTLFWSIEKYILKTKSHLEG